ncbi:hypothetical protein L228DRAFT_238729 [Xylona heveae TC161]|uniref:Uncharacterized protein n=1 Tax=Xylona heveae (strain CBS 132557 / TC161) TaxID=1328760 RepID=A0A165H074_XYLHT|nr:hypothetical protein L228DRAFT_238729 [Xylona heveae TC161]KZF22822.1 hypothetical protein L228DRAFT_238729 [Xylona heveae TC161]
MKRKFGLRLTPIKVTSSAIPSPAVHNVDHFLYNGAESPVFIPASPLIVRRFPLTPLVDSQLRHSCAQLLRDIATRQTNHDDGHIAFDDSISREGTRQDRQKIAFEQPPQLPPLQHHRRPSEPTFSVQDPWSLSDSTGEEQAPRHAAGGFGYSSDDNATASYTQPEHHKRHSSVEPGSGLAGAAAYHINRFRNPIPAGASYGTSSSTSRSNTTTDRSFTRSTAVTSVAISPSLQDRSFSKGGTGTVSRVGSVAKKRTATPASQPTGHLSRASSIKEGIKEYIRPRSSSASIRSKRSQRSVDSSKESSGPSWWSGITRRSSLKAASREKKQQQKQQQQEEETRTYLNRALPPLPSLDMWDADANKETPPEGTIRLIDSSAKQPDNKKHVANMMRQQQPSKTSGKSKQQQQHQYTSSTESNAVVVDKYGMHRALSYDEERAREHRLRRTVEEKMRGAAAAAQGKDTASGRDTASSDAKQRMQSSRSQQSYYGHSGSRPVDAHELAQKLSRMGVHNDDDSKEHENSPGWRKKLTKFGLGLSKKHSRQELRAEA